MSFFDSVDSFMRGPMFNLDSVTDFFSGYTSANSANRFNTEQQQLQYMINRDLAKDQYGYNKSLQQMAQDFNAEQSALAFARQNALFDRQMAADNTRYSRAMADLRRAGVNPLLVTGGLQTSSPSPSSVNSASSSASSVGLPSVGMGSSSQHESLTGAVSSLSSVFNTFSSLAQLGSNITNSQADTALKVAQRGESAARAALDMAKAQQTLEETDKPGLLGQAIRSLQNLGRDSADKASDLSSDIHQFNAHRDMSTAAESARTMQGISEARKNMMKTEALIEQLESKPNKSPKELEKIRRLKNAQKYRHGFSL